MSTKNRLAYGFSSPIEALSPRVVFSKRAPGVKDRAAPGTQWVKNDGSHKAIYFNEGIIKGDTIWSIISYDYIKGEINSPGFTAIMDVYKGEVLLKGFTTASNSSVKFSILNHLVKETSNVTVSAICNSFSDVKITVTNVRAAENILYITITNLGSAALDSDVKLLFSLI